MSPSTVDTLLLAPLHRIGDGCIHCGEAATQLAKPTRPGAEYVAVCPYYLWDPDDQCDEPYHEEADTHGPECGAEPYEMLPLDELLTAIGVQL